MINVELLQRLYDGIEGATEVRFYDVPETMISVVRVPVDTWWGRLIGQTKRAVRQVRPVVKPKNLPDWEVLEPVQSKIVRNGQELKATASVLADVYTEVTHTALWRGNECIAWFALWDKKCLRRGERLNIDVDMTFDGR